MESADEAPAPYVVPRYVAEGDPAWYHVLHGTVPGHQIDLIYAPDVPQGHLTQNHFGHLARLMKYIEPREGAPYAFALGNLSRDDVQHEPGHGGVALIFALRVAGVTDHAGRANPPYAHGVLAIDRGLDYVTLLEAASVFYRRFLERDPQSEDPAGSFYRTYFRTMQEHADQVERFLHDYVADFNELPQPQKSRLGWEWEADEAALPKRVTIVHADDELFTTVADAAATLGAMLYKSNIKWTSITSGRDIEIIGGISIRFVPASEAPRDGKGLVLSLADLPSDEAEIAEKIFGAKSRRPPEVKPVRKGWRDALAEQKADEAGAAAPAAPTVADPPAVVPTPRSTNRPPPAGSSRPAPMPAAAVADSFDEAATVRAPLEAVPAPAFDARRSSSTKGMPAPPEPRRPTPPTGTPAARSSKASSPAPAPVVVAPTPPLEPDAIQVHLSEPPPGPKPRTGMWVAIVGGLAVLVAVVIAVASGSSDSDSSPSGAATDSAPPPATSSAPVSTSPPPGPSPAPATPSGSSGPSPNPPSTAPVTVTTTAPGRGDSKPLPTTPATTPKPPATIKTPPTSTKPTPGGLRGPLRLPGSN